MADFARVLAAVDQVLGTEGLTRYSTRAGTLAADALTGDPFVMAMRRATGRTVPRYGRAAVRAR